ncbi:MAG TPA: ferritin-like domain-containing protein [Abditibacteriaceae bacterium]
MPHDTIVPSDTLGSEVPAISAEASEVASPSRRSLLAIGAVAAAAVAVGASPANADLVRSLRNILHLDPIVANFAFELEELQMDFFTRVLQSDAYRGLQVREQNLFNAIASEDTEHYQTIKMYRNRRGIKNSGHFESPNASSTRPSRLFNYPTDAFKTRDGLLSTALDIKETSVFAYHGAVDLVNKDTLLLAAAIAGVEGRHLAMLREISGIDPLPSPFEGSLPPQASGRRLSRYGFRGGGRNAVTNQPSQ